MLISFFLSRRTNIERSSTYANQQSTKKILEQGKWWKDNDLINYWCLLMRSSYLIVVELNILPYCPFFLLWLRLKCFNSLLLLAWNDYLLDIIFLIVSNLKESLLFSLGLGCLVRLEEYPIVRIWWWTLYCQSIMALHCYGAILF